MTANTWEAAILVQKIYANASLSRKLTSLKVIHVIKIIFKQCHARRSAAILNNNNNNNNIITDDGDVVVGQI